MLCMYPPTLLSTANESETRADEGARYDLKQMLSKSSISRMPEELRKHEAAQQKSQKGSGQKKIEDSSGFAGKGGWQ